MYKDGFNPMTWDCNKGGVGLNCFNVKRRPKIEVFSDCFPRRINFGDVDGLVELNGYFCLLEWKGEGGSVRTGQRISYEAFTRHNGNVVFVVNGNPETMVVQSYQMFWQGKESNTHSSTMDQLKSRIKKWVEYVEQAARVGRGVAKK